MAEPTASRGVVNVAEINPYAPRPYTFTEAALCLRDALRAAGYRSEIFLNKTDAERVTIVLGALPPHLPAVDQLDARRTVIFNFEQLASAPSVTGTQYAAWLRRWLVADYHSSNVDWLRAMSGGVQQVVELPLAPSASIAFRPELPYEPTVDVLFYGTLNPRREEMLRRIRDAGMTVETVAGAFGEELAPAIKRARLVLHVHFYETGLFPVARILQPVAQGVPIVCETSVFSQLSDWSPSGIVFAPYDALVQSCRELLDDEAQRVQRARRAQEFAATLDVAASIERLLQALVRMTPPLAPPMPIAPPVGAAPPVPAAAPVPMPVPLAAHAQLSNEEIEAILAHEAEQLPPEAHLPAPPVTLAERQPGEGRYGKWWLALLIIFGVYTLWMTLR